MLLTIKTFVSVDALTFNSFAASNMVASLGSVDEGKVVEIQLSSMVPAHLFPQKRRKKSETLDLQAPVPFAWGPPQGSWLPYPVLPLHMHWQPNLPWEQCPSYFQSPPPSLALKHGSKKTLLLSLLLFIQSHAQQVPLEEKGF